MLLQSKEREREIRVHGNTGNQNLKRVQRKFLLYFISTDERQIKRMTEMIYCFETIADHLRNNMAWNPLCIYQEDKFLKLLPIFLKTRLFEELGNREVQGFKVGSRFDDTLNCDDITGLSGIWGA